MDHQNCKIEIRLKSWNVTTESKSLFSPPVNDFSFDVELPPLSSTNNDSGGMIELTVESKKDFTGILVTTDFYEAERRPDISLGHWWVGESTWFKAVEDTPDPCGITHKK